MSTASGLPTPHNHALLFMLGSSERSSGPLLPVTHGSPQGPATLQLSVNKKTGISPITQSRAEISFITVTEMAVRNY